VEKSAMSFRGLACGAALVLVMTGIRAEAAWDNAFQVTCFGCRNRASKYYYAPQPAVAYSSPIAAEASPGPCCSTSYVQRCYYVPVTSYKTVLEPVTSYKTSYYYEPVCSYRTSCYRDPCSGASIQVTQPVTSYRLRSQCNAVTSYVQRCMPVTSYRMAYRLEPVTVCPPPCPCGSGTPAPGAPATAEGNLIPSPGVPQSQEGPAVPQSFPQPAAPSFKPSTGAPRFDKITGNLDGRATIRGQVVQSNYVSPLRGARVLFVSKQSDQDKQAATADAAGRFAVNLPAGGWKLFVGRADGSLEYHSSIDVQQSQNRQVMVVSR
jgi:hypothetical protein